MGGKRWHNRRERVLANATANSEPPRCTYCGVRVSRKISTWPPEREAVIHFFTLDHIIPKATGGSDRVENLTAACYWCNQDRGDMPLDDFIRSLGERAVITPERAREMMREAIKYCPKLRDLAHARIV
jgi:5-methylcytosine-specific restriction endonuclease McrA